MTHVERLARVPTHRLVRGHTSSRRIFNAFIALVVSFSAVTALSRPAGAVNVAQEKARAADLYAQIQRVGAQVQSLGQKYDLAHLNLAQITNRIVNTRKIVASIQSKVIFDDSRLKTAAVFAYVNYGADVGANPLFSGNAAQVGATTVYSQLAEGNIASQIASLKSSQVQLTQERGLLVTQQSQALSLTNAAAAALRQAQELQRSIESARSQVEGQISAYYNAIQAAANEASQRAVSSAIAAPTPSISPAPPPSSLGQAAVIAAEKYIGVWYVWGGASPTGLDCSGLVMLAYQAVGVSLPHYSGAQYDDTVRVPLWDIQPGDLLFYGPGGSEHEAMYVGNGMMIEAPQTGYRVNITPVRLGYGFVGIGRVSA